MWQMYFCGHKNVSQKLFLVAKRNTSRSSVAADCAKGCAFPDTAQCYRGQSWGPGSSVKAI